MGIAFQSVLACASAATQHLSDVETLSGTAPLSLFLLTIAKSGERKSSCDKLATQPFHEWEAEQAKEYQEAKAQFDFDLAVFETQSRQAVKASVDGGEVVERDTLVPPSPPVIPRKLLSDPTYEGVLRHLETGDPSIAIFADEGAQFFGGPAMGRDNQLKTAAGFSKFWDAAQINRTRAGSEQMTFRNRRMALHLMIQPGVAESVLADQALLDQGLLSRTLIAHPLSRIGQRFIDVSPEEAERRALAQTDLTAFQRRIAALLRIPGPRQDFAPLELNPRVLHLSQDARALLVQFANAIEQQQAAGGNLSHITGFASKAAEQATRVAGVLTALQDHEAECVSLHAMQSAVSIVSWHLTEAQRLLDNGEVSKDMRDARCLLDWLKLHRRDMPFNRRDLTRNGPSRIRGTDLSKKLLSILEEHRHVRPSAAAKVNGTRTSEAWELCDV
ncbi:MAG: YfjI family protein [Pseudomonadota bacterium]